MKKLSRKTEKLGKTLSVLAIAAVLSACGGGGGGGGSYVKTPDTTPDSDLKKFDDAAVRNTVAKTYPWADTDLVSYIAKTVPSKELADYGPGNFNSGVANEAFPSYADGNVHVTISEIGQWDITDPAQMAFQNDISGDGGFVLESLDDWDSDNEEPGTDGDKDGVLFMTGNNTYTGNTWIKSGVLIVTNKLTGSPRITVDYGAGLAAIGFNLSDIDVDEIEWEEKVVSDGGRTVEIRSDIYNSGYVGVGFKGLKLVGNLYNQSSNARIGVSINSLLEISGVLDFAGGELVVDADDYWSKKAIPGSIFENTIIKAAGGILNWTNRVDDSEADYVQIDSVNLTSGNTEMVVKGKRNNTKVAAYSVLGYVPVRVENTGENLDRLFDALAANPQPGALQSAAADIIYTPAAQLAQTWDSLSGEIFASSQNLTFKQSKVLNRTLSNRLFSLSDPAGRKNTGLWFEGIGGKGTIYKVGWAEGKSEVWGGQAGLDYALTDKFIFGGTVAASKAKATFNHYAGESKSTSVSAAAYGIYNFSDQLYALGRVGIGYADVKTERDVYTGAWNHLKSSRHDLIYSAYAEAGYKIPLTDALWLTPFAGISHDIVKRGKFTESGSPFGLTDGAETFSQTSGVVGLRAEAKLAALKLTGHVTHYAAFNKEDLGFRAKLTGGSPAGVWDVKGIGLPRHTTWIGIGAEIPAGPAFSVTASYDLGVERSLDSDHVVSVGFRYTF